MNKLFWTRFLLFLNKFLTQKWAVREHEANLL
jgi:hypothetical protein